MFEKVCVVCGKKFAANRSNQVTCSEECRKERQREHNRNCYHNKNNVAPKRICAYCGKEFVPNHATTKYCSSECRIMVTRKTALAYYHNVRKTAKAKATTCPECGKVFYTTKSNKKFCSEDCQKKRSKRTCIDLRRVERIIDEMSAEDLFPGVPEERVSAKPERKKGRVSSSKKSPVRADVAITNQQIERLQGVTGVSYGKLKQMQYFGTLYQFCKERGITEL